MGGEVARLQTTGCLVIMAVSVSRDLSVTVTDSTMDKLTDRRRALRESIQKGEPKVLGVSQVMVGVTIISYSLPLLPTEFTEIMTFGVPWWSGVVFIFTGAVTIVMEKQANMKFLCFCLGATAVALLISILALIFYFVDLKNADKRCNHNTEICDEEHHPLCISAQLCVFTRGVKSCLLLFTMVQTVLSSIMLFTLFKERRSFTNYSTLNQLIPPSPTASMPPELN
ncbi:hypothetical protein AAFF_G00271860 [Aldrovandia affinis]|uniref:Uncharacterized protein n=1 Tax=Aldrovandia affinis TaxID=143900 RepID=A0AAD7RAZ6_9TELE|nr:hypothetical protein AAFF_G00271860 [Aldrovandia affinis]